MARRSLLAIGPVRTVSTAGDRGDDENCLSLFNASSQAIREPDVVIVDEEVDVAPHPTLLVEHACFEPRMRSLQRGDDLPDSRALHLHAVAAAGQGAELRRNAHDHWQVRMLPEDRAIRTDLMLGPARLYGCNRGWATDPDGPLMP